MPLNPAAVSNAANRGEQIVLNEAALKAKLVISTDIDFYKNLQKRR